MSASYKKELSKQAEARIAAAGGSIRKLAESHRREAGAAMRGAAQNIAPRTPKIAAPIDPRRRYLPSDRPDIFIGVSGSAGYESTTNESEIQDSATDDAEPAFPSFNGNVRALARYVRKQAYESPDTTDQETAKQTPVDTAPPGVLQRRHNPIILDEESDQEILDRINADGEIGDRLYPDISSYFASIQSGAGTEVMAALNRLHTKRFGGELLDAARKKDVRFRGSEYARGIVTDLDYSSMSASGEAPKYLTTINVYVNPGALGIKASDVELLAFILGHELAHVKYGHESQKGMWVLASEAWVEDVFEPQFLTGFSQDVQDYVAAGNFKDSRKMDHRKPLDIFAEGYVHMWDILKNPTLGDDDG